MLEDLLREHPEIVLDVLRSHSEDVLDIAQAGANARRKAALEAQWHKEVKNTPQKQILAVGPPGQGQCAAAPVRIVAFSDFTRHYCQQATHVLDEIMKKYGKNVSLVYKHMPLDEQGPGMLAARYFVAVAAQSESKAWKFYDAMYADRDRLLLEGQKFVDEVCDKLGLDKDRLKKDAASDKTARIIAQDLDDAKKLKIDGTPCFLVNGLMVRGALVRTPVRSGRGHRSGSGTLTSDRDRTKTGCGMPRTPVFFMASGRAEDGMGLPGRRRGKDGSARCAVESFGRAVRGRASVRKAGGLSGRSEGPFLLKRTARAADVRQVCGMVRQERKRPPMRGGGQGKGQPGGCPLCEGRAWRNARQD